MLSADDAVAVVAWLEGAAMPLAAVAPGDGHADVEPLRATFAGARVVALGEATHGTREFLLAKHGLVEFLVEEMAFNVFAIEAGFPESLAVGAYVTTGRGDARTALAGMWFWTRNTEEVLALVEWFRDHDADLRPERQVRFLGFDMQFTSAAVAQRWRRFSAT